MKILITGGAGYVGSATLRHLVGAGHSVVAYDNLKEGHRGAVKGFCELVEADILDGDTLEKTLRDFRPDAVMHFAAATYVGESVEKPEYHYRNNIAGTQSVLDAMRACDVSRLVFSSTCATYGLATDEFLSEETPQVPASPYARTKLAVEWMIRDFSHAHGLGFTILRYFNASGASPDGQHGEDHRPETHLIPLVLQVALGQRKELAIFGTDYPTPDGTCIRDYVHTSDLASAHQLAVEATESGKGDVFNIGTGNGASVMEIIEACRAVSGNEIPTRIEPRRPGDPPRLVAVPKKLKETLGWDPQYASISDVVETAYRWHRDHPDGYPD